MHLGLETMTLLGHSASTNVVTLYAATIRPGWRADPAHRSRPCRLVSRRSVPTKPSGPLGEPWYAEAVAAWNAWDELPEDASETDAHPFMLASAPFSYGRWEPPPPRMPPPG